LLRRGDSTTVAHHYRDRGLQAVSIDPKALREPRE